ncbi:hypothetical protein KR222_008068, partial [Zaprionus bogoriensis]
RTGERRDNPGVATRWIYYGRKEDLEGALQELGLDAEGKVDELRKRLAAFVKEGKHSPVIWNKITEWETRLSRGVEATAVGASQLPRTEGDARATPGLSSSGPKVLLPP